MAQWSKIKEGKARIIIFVLEKTIWKHSLKSKKAEWSWCLAAPGMGTARSLHVRWNFSAHIFHHWGCTLASQKNDLLKDRWPLGKELSSMPQPDPASTFRKSETHSSRIKKPKVPPFPNFFCSSRTEVEGWHSQPWMLLMPLCQNLTHQIPPTVKCCLLSFHRGSLWLSGSFNPLNNWNCFMSRQERAN